MKNKITQTDSYPLETGTRSKMVIRKITALNFSFNSAVLTLGFRLDKGVCPHV